MDLDLVGIMEQLGTIAATLAGAALAIVKTRDAIRGLSNAKPLQRRTIQADLELLKVMDSSDPGYGSLRKHIASQVDVLISKKAKNEQPRRPWREILIPGIGGLLMAGGFGYWTYHIVSSTNISNWWVVATIWMAWGGLGLIISARERPLPESADSGSEESAVEPPDSVLDESALEPEDPATTIKRGG